MTSKVSDILGVLLLQKEAGVKNPLRIVPLFETLSDLQNSSKIVDNLFKNRWYTNIFSNEQEILSLLNTKNFGEVLSFAKNLKKLLVITRGEKGSVAINGDEVVECGIHKNLKIVDLTGAGDLFAAGFLHGIANNLSTKESLEKGTEMSSKVIQQIGARL